MTNNILEKTDEPKMNKVVCVLGAGYCSSVKWWNHIKGLSGLYIYGLDEGLMSFKTWCYGGTCYILDDFGRYIKEEFEYEIEEPTEELDEEGNIIFNTVKKTGTKWKENPDYDNTKEYTPRDQRQEWSAIGMLGVLSVYDDGTCQVNGFCKVSDGGIATKCEKGIDTYRVINRKTDNIIEVVFR